MRSDKPILIFSVEFPPHLGGAATYASNLAKGLSSIGQKVNVLTVDRSAARARQKRIDERLREQNGIEVTRVAYIPKLYLLIMARVLRRMIRLGDFAAVILADSGAHKCCAFFLRSLPVPVWAVFHGSEAANYFGSGTRLFRMVGGPSKLRRLLLGINGGIAVSEWIRNEITNKLPDIQARCSVIYHGVEVDQDVLSIQKSDAKTQLHIDPDTHVIFSASRLIEEKGQDVLIRALAPAIRRIPGIKLLIAGQGPARPRLESLAASEGVLDQVEFVGYLDQEQMGLCYRACDVFIQPSRFPYDSFGLVYLEANACGRTVVAGDVAGVSESVEDGVSGVLIDPLDTDRLSELIITFIEDLDFRETLEQRALERVSRQFRLEGMARTTVDLIFRGN